MVLIKNVMHMHAKQVGVVTKSEGSSKTTCPPSAEEPTQSTFAES